MVSDLDSESAGSWSGFVVGGCDKGSGLCSIPRAWGPCINAPQEVSEGLQGRLNLSSSKMGAIMGAIWCHFYLFITSSQDPPQAGGTNLKPKGPPFRNDWTFGANRTATRLTLWQQVVVPPQICSKIDFFEMGPNWDPFRVLRVFVLFRCTNSFRRTSPTHHTLTSNQRSINSTTPPSKRASKFDFHSKSSKFLPETMKVDGYISGTVWPIMLIFGHIGANILNF